ncbi:hypothetical protein [Actinoplanes sp. NPDC051851]|uniref:hypothetical protein n=1 Tax=Actinoplanes sp. NPDC051851 TaxID=3154753 RepID=UPI003439E034
MPHAVRRGSRLLVGCAVVAVPMLAIALAAWWRVEQLADAYAAVGQAAVVADDVEGLRGDLVLQIAVFGAIAVGALLLAVLIRRPFRWARTATLTFAGVTLLGLVCGLMGGPLGRSAAPSETPFPDLSRAGDAQVGLGEFPLAHSYVLIIGFPGVVLLAGLIAVTIQMTRSGAIDYYRPETRVADPDWSGFVEKRRRAVSGEPE